MPSPNTEFAAPPERIWALLTDAARYPSWNPAVLSIDGRIAAGEKIALRAAVNPKRTFTLRVGDVQANRGMVWSSGMPLGLFRGVRTFRLQPDGERTRFSMEEVYSGPMAPMITRAIPDQTESFAQFGDGLKSAAEAP